MSHWIRQMIRRLSRNRVVRKRLPADLGGGRIHCSPEALLSVWKPGWQSRHAQALMGWARRFVEPGMQVWDLGANQGIFSFAAAAKAGTGGGVVAFEPDLFLADLMRRSVASGTHLGAPVQILPVAVADEVVLAQFEIAQTDRALNHLSSARGNPRTGGAREQKLVPCVTLDWLVGQLPTPNFLKIDVEGAELSALRGAGQLLSVHRPRLIVETAPENAVEMGQYLSGLDYLIFDVDGDLSTPRATPAWNSLLWPRERVVEMKALCEKGMS